MSEPTEKKKGNGKISFLLLLLAVAVELLLLIFHFTNGSWAVLQWLEGAIFALMSIFVAVNAWGFVKDKKALWKFLYVLLVLAVIACIVLPRIF